MHDPITAPVPFLHALFDSAVAADDPGNRFAAAADLGRAAGCAVHLLGQTLTGEAGQLGASHAAAARALAATIARGAPPILLLSGGHLSLAPDRPQAEPPNLAYAKALVEGLQGYERIYALACAMSGQEGASGAAGATVAPESLGPGPSPVTALSRQGGAKPSDAGDFRALLILPPTAINSYWQKG